MKACQPIAGYILLLILLSTQLITKAQEISKPNHSIFLVSNLADVLQDSSLTNSLYSRLAEVNHSFTLLINGDIVKRDANDDLEVGYKKLELMLRKIDQLENGKTVLLAGDRDWNSSGEDGWKAVRALEKMVKASGFQRVTWVVKDGCPGPKEIEINESILLIAINTQWWNHPYRKPGPADADCKISSEDIFWEELEDVIEENQNRNILIAGHFPLFSLGEYGGRIPLKQHIFPFRNKKDKTIFFPFPVLGSTLAAYRKNIGSREDLSNKLYSPFGKKLASIMTSHESIIYTSGHERNLQILRDNNNYFVNSGSLTNPGFAGGHKSALLSKSWSGLIQLDYFENGRIKAIVHQLIHGNQWIKENDFVLYHSLCDSTENVGPFNTVYIPCQERMNVASSMDPSHPGSKPVIAGSEYDANGMKRLFFGDHYRDTWIAKVTVPVLNMDTVFGGLEVLKKGGGRQTTSLKMKANNGSEYVFRSVNKDPVKALPYNLRETFVSDVLRDQTTTQHPYGALAADILLNEIDVLHAHPKLYVLPDDAVLGPFQDQYGNLFGMLEDRPTNPKKVERPFAGADEVLKSYKLFRKLYQDHNNKVNTEAFARARVFDILVGDWGKHEDNWKWAGFIDGQEVLYEPIPRDRDHVFSQWDGLLPWLADREWAKASGEHFGYKIKDVRSLMWQARHLDRFIGNELDREDWLKASKRIQASITDEIIEKAVKNMPPEVYETSGKEVAAKLRSRIKRLDYYTLQYYRLLAKEVDVVGSNKPEFFDVKRNIDGSVKVMVYNMSGENTKGEKLLYERDFFPHETKEIRLYGLDGRDEFNITGNVKESIKIRIIGGPGRDNVSENSDVRSGGKHTLIYEKSEKANILLGSEGKRIDHWNPKVYNYNRTSFAYNTYFPLPLIKFNADDGFGLSLGVDFVKQKFGKENFAGKHSVNVSFTTVGNTVFNYNFQLHHFIKKWDLTTGVVAARPDNFTYFFGEGNNTRKDEDLFDNDFYKTRYNSYRLNIGLLRDFWKNSRISFQFGYESNDIVSEGSNILETPGNSGVPGSDETELAEIRGDLDLDFRDNSGFPKSGMRLYLGHHSGILTNKGNESYNITRGFMEHYSTLRTGIPITLGIKFGGSKSSGDVPFYKLAYLGQNNNLRGFLRNRFTGNSTIYLNTDLRFHLFDFKTSIVPMKFGLIGFFDTGRIYDSNDTSGQWHQGYGGGFFLVPLDERLTINVSVGFSEEESGLLLFSIGRVFSPLRFR
ncbi:hypothetical protein QQ008_16420 [Fulvivirgaceae bacterium BMA10]|uniref:Bacterial surface antigen (D15) domain-containing protein n=1 Tax=Splendidivirga corallicola TaxID=3051826 RepID=A0ABT8KQI1_9BACT|nr:hypothetical protein [Fulvivirgaceae bacterium BMA10]